MKHALKTLLLIALCLGFTACDGSRIGGTVADVGARIGDRVDVGVGVTKSTDGWWYFGGKIRGKPGKGSDAEEGEPEWETPPIIFQK